MKLNYTTPKMEATSFRAEQGYAISGGGDKGFTIGVTGKGL